MIKSELCRDCGEEIHILQNVCKSCATKAKMLPKTEVAKVTMADLRENIHSILTKEERFRMVEKIDNNPGLFLANVSYDPLCLKFYGVDCVGCPFKKFESVELPGCKRYFKITVGDATDKRSNIIRREIFAD